MDEVPVRFRSDGEPPAARQTNNQASVRQKGSGGRRCSARSRVRPPRARRQRGMAPTFAEWRSVAESAAGFARLRVVRWNAARPPSIQQSQSVRPPATVKATAYKQR